MTTPRSPLHDHRDPHARVAPVVATVLLVPLVPFAFVLGGLSAMATDSCGPDSCSSALMTSLTLIYGLLAYGGFFTFLAYVTLWALPRTRRWAALRAWLAAAAVTPPAAVLFLVLTLPRP
ncbi:hypothetical protein [Streptomyces sp. NBC_00199]|uniref:hypothetical protein n=1 Tax=Streptomyces sp. NBC_00199 TaxID=2975678 RepID=UPI00224EDB31|nr:hypothetical protein [Streptomyces sp. NBC_00199]MCX5265165.1 hypothetical protein [Streptomyces sp. NBC_00199]